MSTYFADVAWSTKAGNVRLADLPYYYYMDVNPLDPNEPGSYPITVDVGDWFLDYAGYPFLIEEVNGNTLKVYDINERGNGTTSAYGPYNNMTGYVYRPKHNAFLLSQAQLRKLDPSAKDVISNIEKGIIWKYRGVSIDSDGTLIENVTKLDLENLEITSEDNTDGWQGGKKITLKAGGGLEAITINQIAHGFDNDIVYYNGTTWVKAQADNEETCGTHIAVRVDDDNFKIYSYGEIPLTMTDEEGNPLVPGDYYFLSKTTAGKITGTKPTAGITQYILQALDNNIVSVSIEEPYDTVESSSGEGGASTFLELVDTPASYDNGKFLYSTDSGIDFKNIEIGDVVNLTSILNTKAQLNLDNIFTGNNTFSGNLFLTGLLEQTESKILYVNTSTGKISYGNAPAGGGTPADPIYSMQFNSNGSFGASPLYYNTVSECFGFGTVPDDYDWAYVRINPGDKYGIFEAFEVYGGSPEGEPGINTLQFKVNSEGVQFDRVYALNYGEAININDGLIVDDLLSLSSTRFGTGSRFISNNNIYQITKNSTSRIFDKEIYSEEYGVYDNPSFQSDPLAGTKFYIEFDGNTGYPPDLYLENSPVIKGKVILILTQDSTNWTILEGTFFAYYVNSSVYFNSSISNLAGDPLSLYNLDFQYEIYTNASSVRYIRFYFVTTADSSIKNMKAIVNIERYMFNDINIDNYESLWH